MSELEALPGKGGDLVPEASEARGKVGNKQMRIIESEVQPNKRGLSPPHPTLDLAAHGSSEFHGTKQTHTGLRGWLASWGGHLGVCHPQIPFGELVTSRIPGHILRMMSPPKLYF